jgi:carbamoyltransferase
MYILGISAFYHDSAAALLRDGDLVAAAQEERFSRIKFDHNFPIQAIKYCFHEAKISARDLSYIVFYEKPLPKFERILMSQLSTFPRSWQVFREAMISWFSDKLWVKSVIADKLSVPMDRILFVEHHLSHAASAMYCSPFQDAAVLTVDGVGEWTTTTMGRASANWGNGQANSIELTDEIRFPHSLGLLYSAFTGWLGFKVNSGEYKVMGMAPYGTPKYLDKVEKLIRVYDDGSFWLNIDYFSYHYSLSQTVNQKFISLFGPPRKPESPFFTRTTGDDITGREKEADENQYYADVAASVQHLTEEILLKIADRLHRETGLKNLVMAGGVALNSVANGRIMRETPFEQVYIQPNAGDAGGALGSALYVWHVLLGNPRRFVMEHAYYGEEYKGDDIHRFLNKSGLHYEEINDIDRLSNYMVDALLAQQVIGLFQGRFEWGPRALGNRSIIADPRRAEMKEVVNSKIKFRELFRPFAPVVTEEDASDWFDLGKAEGQYPQRFMLMVSPVLSERQGQIPAVTHMGTGRLQTVNRRWNPLYYEVIRRFGQATDVPVLLNTSFNLRAEPIVTTPDNAFNTFSKSDLDILVMENFLITKSKTSRQVARRAADRKRDERPGKVLSSPQTPAPILPFDDLRCPACQNDLETKNGARALLVCVTCGREFGFSNGIPLLYWPTEETELDNVTDIVKAFYEENPFPNYAQIDSSERLIEKAKQSIFAGLLDEQIPENANVLEVGCGTGQLSNFLAIRGRHVYGADICLNSLTLGRNFSLAEGIDSVKFTQMNLFRPIFPKGSFDYVLCNGVLHHTHDPFAGFSSISKLVRPGGHIVIGLYNKFGRVWTNLRRDIFRISGNRFQFLDPYMNRTDVEDIKKRVWFNDQYLHPHEMSHTLDEVLGWLDQTGFEFVNAIPKPSPFVKFSEFESLFDKTPVGSRFEHVLAQSRMALSGGAEGGFFIVIAKSPSDSAM